MSSSDIGLMKSVLYNGLLLLPPLDNVVPEIKTISGKSEHHYVRRVNVGLPSEDPNIPPANRHLIPDNDSQERS